MFRRSEFPITAHFERLAVLQNLPKRALLFRRRLMMSRFNSAVMEAWSGRPMISRAAFLWLRVGKRY